MTRLQPDVSYRLPTRIALIPRSASTQVYMSWQPSQHAWLPLSTKAIVQQRYWSACQSPRTRNPAEDIDSTHSWPAMWHTERAWPWRYWSRKRGQRVNLCLHIVTDSVSFASSSHLGLPLVPTRVNPQSSDVRVTYRLSPLWIIVFACRFLSPQVQEIFTYWVIELLF